MTAIRAVGGGCGAPRPARAPALLRQRPVRPGRGGEDHFKALGPRQRGDDENLYHGERRRAPAPGGTAGVGGLATEFLFCGKPTLKKPGNLQITEKRNLRFYIF